MIALIDYGAGNLASVKKAFAAVEAEIFIPTTPADLDIATAIVVPGVGHFGATSALDEPWRQAVRHAIAVGRPLLGICLGLQWLFEGSTEAPQCTGLGLFPGSCQRLPEIDRQGARLKVPHVGWNDLQVTPGSRMLDGVGTGSQVYFTHSYAAPVTEGCAAITEHGAPFASAVERGLVWGVQFHPEKSSDAGLRILRNFVAVTRASAAAMRS